MSEWQPIETSPRDGTWFLAYDLKHQWRDRASVAVVRRLHPATAPMDKNGYTYGNLTHWMPLPDPPTEVSRG